MAVTTRSTTGLAGPIDVHLILRRDARVGPEALLCSHSGPAGRLWQLPGGHVTGLHEDIVSCGIAYGGAHQDPELVERGRRTLARLRTEHHFPHRSAGEAL